MTKVVWSITLAVACGSGAFGLLASGLGCAADPGSASAPSLAVADLDSRGYIARVQPVIERRCGSLDCHGQLPRGLRVYGADSLRLPNDAGLIVGSGKTTLDEARATYLSIVGLQPEKTDALAHKSPRTAPDAYGLLLLSKPLGLERHRPGPSLRKGEPAERCITSWLVGALDPEACAAGVPPPM